MGFAKSLVLRLIIVVAVLWACRVGWHIHQEVRVRQLQRPDATVEHRDFLSMAGIAVGMLVAQVLFRRLFAGVARAMIPKKSRWSNAVWEAKQVRCSDAVFKFVYYATLTTWCVTILRDTPWLPSVLGGAGNTRSCWTGGYPFQQNPPDLRRFYLTALGYHLSEAALILLENPKPDFWEMLLHHALTCSLTYYSYVLNYTRIGSLVLLLHGATDIFVYASKALVDTPFIRVLTLSYVGLILTYGYFRIFVFPLYIVHSTFLESQQEIEPQRLFVWSYMNFAMCCLLMLHIYWFGLIIKSGHIFGKTGQARDLQANLSMLELEKQKKRS